MDQDRTGMTSPFPGVDPYLELFWGDIHTRLMVYISDQINDQLPADLQARVEESVSVDLNAGSRWIYPDIKVTEQIDPLPISPIAIADLPVAEPALIPVDDPATERHIEIVDLAGSNRVVTAIELLGPANKTSEAGRTAYRRKQQEYRTAHVNLVEIDLIRSGSPIVAAPISKVSKDVPSDFMVCIRRVQTPAFAEIISISIRKPVPNFRIPLRPADADAVVQLQPLLNDCYRRGRYVSIDYSKAPVPRLDDSHQDWAKQLLQGGK